MEQIIAAQESGAGTDWTRTFYSSLDRTDRKFIPGGETFATLHSLAGGIRRLGENTEGSPPLLCLLTENKALTAAAILSALTGGPRLVLPFAFSPQALQQVVTTLPVTAILADETWNRSDFAASDPAVYTRDMLDLDDAPPEQFTDADETFLMVFTGGSTGTPQVWSKTPRNIIGEVCYMVDRFVISPNDIFLSTVPAHHIYGLLFSVLVPLAASAAVLAGIHTLPAEILRLAAERDVTVLVSVPTCYRALKNDFPEGHRLRLAFSSAGPLDPFDANHFREKSGIDITEIYGSTETGGVALRQRRHDGDAWNSMDPVRWNITGGRLQVRSPFISPTLEREDNGFFTTADRALNTSDGRFILQGRADDVVKIGGKRVDLLEIRDKIRAMDGVRDALVVTQTRINGREANMTALVETEKCPADLQQTLSSMLEPYAMPRRFVTVATIPRTRSGKHDRKAIDDLVETGPHSDTF